MEPLTKTYTKQELIELVRANPDTIKDFTMEQCQKYVKDNPDKAPFIFIVEKA